MLIYRECLMKRRLTIGLSNGDLAKLDISRQTKYRALAELQEAGVVTIKNHNGRSTQVTLHWFP